MITHENESISSKINTTFEIVEEWISNELKASNDKLYSILSRCLNISSEIQDVHRYRNELDSLIDDAKIKINGQASVIAKVVRLSFQSRKSRWSPYTQVLEKAQQLGISGADFPEWIIEQGGIESTRLVKSKANEAPKCSYKALAKNKLNAIAAPQSVKFQSELLTKPNCNVVVLGYARDDGTIELFEAIANERMVDAFKLEWGKQIADRRNVIDQETNTANAVKKMVANVTEANNEKAA